jgi:hypothetical protein
MSTTGQELLESFDLLPEREKREIASEMIRRAFAPMPELDESQLRALYAEFAEEDGNLADEGLVDYERGLRVEDAE